MEKVMSSVEELPDSSMVSSAMADLPRDPELLPPMKQIQHQLPELLPTMPEMRSRSADRPRSSRLSSDEVAITAVEEFHQESSPVRDQTKTSLPRLNLRTARLTSTAERQPKRTSPRQGDRKFDSFFLFNREFGYGMLLEWGHRIYESDWMKSSEYRDPSTMKALHSRI